MGRINANSANVDSTPITFSILIQQQKCLDGSWAKTNISLPKYGANLAAAVALLADGSTEIFKIPNYGDTSINFFDQGADFGVRCGPRVMTAKAGGVSYFTVTQDVVTATTYAIRTAPQAAAVAVTTLEVTITYSRYTA